VEAVRRLKGRLDTDPEHRAVVYSNFLESGVMPYEELLKKHKIPYAKFTGDVKPEDRKRIVADYNEGRNKVLLLSSAGGEGLDLKGTRQIQILDPHFNKEKIEQVVGRGIRYKSHAHLPEASRNVDVENYVSTLPKPTGIRRLLGAKQKGSVDQYLRGLSADKDRLNAQVRDLLRTPEPKTASNLGDLMPFRSKAQQRAAFAGAIPGFSKERAKEWADKTDFDSLPEKAAAFAVLEDQLADAFKRAALGSDISAMSRSVGAFKGLATQNALKPPGAAASSAVINPKRSLRIAMKP
jgi:superfamily II DNA/RNA helicase